jgi:HptB-dependent secretion and biofilm anti anti-sigma factor
MALEKHFSEIDSTLTISPGEKFDFASVHDFKATYAEDAEKIKKVVIDLERTEYMDSSALGMLLNMQKTLKDIVSDFEIKNSRPQVKKILEISRFDKKFTIS